MKIADGRLQLTATDLGNFLACRRKTGLDYAVAVGTLERPRSDDPVLEVLRKRGMEHERRYVDAVRTSGIDVDELEGVDRFDRPAAIAATISAMRRGAPAIVQAALASRDGRWFGVIDMLRRVEAPSALGSWSYEALDTKLAQETRGATMLQLSLYSDLVAEAQDAAPEYFHVVTPVSEERYRTGDFSAYYRLMKAGLETEAGLLASVTARGPAAADAALPYPEPVAHCGICVWAGACTKRLRQDDHLSFVANSSRLQRNELAAHGITTLAALGRDGLPAGFRPSRGTAATYLRLQDQARLQLAARELGAPGFEALPPESGLGLALLPEPSPGDVFLDLEGATWAREGGREYLFGLVTRGNADGPRDLLSGLEDPKPPVYEGLSAFTDAEERAAFEAVIDRLTDAFDRHPDMHVYHYAPYEPAALKRLMGRYATRGPELDRLLRAERFVDLYAVVRHAVRAGVERYSIKNLENFYGFTREVSLDEAGRCRRLVEQALDLGAPERVKADEFAAVRGYNRDDCVSTLALRDWLETLRAAAIAAGQAIPRPVVAVKEPRDVGALEKRAIEVRGILLAGLACDPAAWTDTDRARWLLAYTGDWHSRESKAAWWEYYRLRDLPIEDLAAEPMAVVGLEFLDRVDMKRNKATGKPTGTVTDRYRYADRQEMEIDEGDTLTLQDESDWGEVVAVDRIERTNDVKKGKTMAELHASSAFSFFHVSTDVIQKSVLDFAEDVAASGLEDTARRDCRRELILRRPPRLAGMTFEPLSDEVAGDFAVRISTALDRTVLAIQGPPGTGKTYTGARMICALVKARKKVGVLAGSHKVIRNLLKGVQKEAAKGTDPVRIAHRIKESLEDGTGILEDNDLDKLGTMLAGGTLDVLGGVAWTFASEKAIDLVDVLFVDEAGQMSLANVLGSARAAGSIVLLGDQQQLDQPTKASHPDGVSVSALDHVLAGRRTMPEGHGIFLPVTRRLAPGIAAFTSEAFYEDRLTGLPELAKRRLSKLPGVDSGALWVMPVEHRGNQGYSQEEVAAIVSLVNRLTSAPVSWVDCDGVERRMARENILIVSPYNAQVARLRRALPGLAIGTVDKFQGQEAAVVIYSMATSAPEDAPRGMEFLYSLNRLNVATSRAQCAAIVVASPALLAPLCSSPRQMQLANALCLYRELAGTWNPAP